MDRPIVQPGMLLPDTILLAGWKNALYGLGHLAQAALGTGTCVVGLVGAQSTVPDLHISIGAGAIYSSQPVDATAYGSLGTDANTIVKQGILAAPTTLTLTAPVTSGYSQVYLVEACYSDTDGGAITEPYYNSASPSSPLNGPANSGASQYTTRQGVCTITLKAGTAAPTGSQTTPSTDAGYVPLYTITLANGQTAITNAQIVTASGAPFVLYNLNNLPFLKSQTDTGTANALVVTEPTISALFVGLTLTVKKSALPNTGATTLNVNGLGATTLVWADGTALASGDWPASVTGIIEYDGTQWNLLSVMGPSVYLRQTSRGIAAYSTAGTFSWTCPAGVYRVKAIVTGAGGGGQGTSVGSSGASGGAGGSAIKVMPVVPGTSYTVVVGAGGAGGGSGGLAGSIGGTSSFNGISATGGGGASANNGVGGVGSGGDDNLTGGDGVDGNPSAANQSTTGGASIWGGGSSGGNPGPATGGAPGGGGGGAYGSTSAGNTGNPGKVYLEY